MSAKRHRFCVCGHSMQMHQLRGREFHECKGAALELPEGFVTDSRGKRVPLDGHPCPCTKWRSVDVTGR